MEALKGRIETLGNGTEGGFVLLFDGDWDRAVGKTVRGKRVSVGD